MTTAERTFRPRLTLAVCIGITVAYVAGAAFLLVSLREELSDQGFERFSIVLIAAIAVLVCVLLGRVHAVATADALLVRNPIRSRRVAWEEIVAVRLGRNDPWAQLDLDDGTTIALMAIQAADGARARRDLAWVRARVAEHEGREPGANP